MSQHEAKTRRIYIYTDGSSKGNPGQGGLGIVMELFGTDYKKEFSEGFRRTTNNRMELLAVIMALEKIKRFRQEVTVFSDSKYVVEAVEKRWVFGWKKKEFQNKKNADLWGRFLTVYLRHVVVFQWIKGHNNHPKNERCHQLATQAAQQERLKIDLEYELKDPFKAKFSS
ncbi:MAG: ribonuclease HI [Flavobacteriales bacterium Tduv]